jgi:hypothetical protein
VRLHGVPLLGQATEGNQMPKVIPPQGLKEVSVRTERGTKIYKADRSGLINVDNPKHAEANETRRFRNSERRGHRSYRRFSVYSMRIRFFLQEML